MASHVSHFAVLQGLECIPMLCVFNEASTCSNGILIIYVLNCYLQVQ